MRAIIVQPDSGTGPSWTGAYVTWEGDPTQAGRRIHRQVSHEFDSDPRAACHYYVTQHPSGWYRIGDTTDDNLCYCHGWQPTVERALGLTPTPTDRLLEWMYVLRPYGMEIRSWRSGPLRTIPWGHTDAWHDDEQAVAA